MRKKIYLYALRVSALVFFSSNVFSTEASVDWEAGAKRGWIEKIYDLNTPEKDLPEYLEKLSKADRKNRFFVKIWYRNVRSVRVTIAEVTEPLNLKIDDQVEVFPVDCDAGKFAHTTKLLSAKE